MQSYGFASQLVELFFPHDVADDDYQGSKDAFPFINIPHHDDLRPMSRRNSNQRRRGRRSRKSEVIAAKGSQRGVRARCERQRSHE